MSERGAAGDEEGEEHRAPGRQGLTSEAYNFFFLIVVNNIYDQIYHLNHF